MTSSLTMANTLPDSSIPSSSSGLNLLVPPNSHDTSLHHMPNVLIVPPEEEHDDNPPWTFFDAKTDAKGEHSTTPDIDTLDVALGIFQQIDNRSPAFHRALSNESSDTVILPKKNSRGEDVASDDARNGDDIIEVVKVRRNEGMSDVTEGKGAGLKKSKTFRARASQALKTIKGVASRKSSVSSSNSAEVWPVQDVTVTDEDMEAGVLPRPSTPSVSRRRSMPLSQLFSSTRKRTSSNVTMATFTSANTSDVPESPASSDFSIISTPSEESFPTPASSLSDRTNQDNSQPSLSKRRSFVSKISMVDLQRLFAPSSPSHPPITSPESAPTLARGSRRDSLPVPPSLPQLSTMRPSQDVFAADSPLQSQRPHSFHASSTRYSLSLPQPASSSSDMVSRSSPAQENIPEETSFEAELRLDSLHFDSLRFDPDEFSF